MKTILELEAPKNYFALVEKIGSKGHYQFRLFLILAFNWFVSTMLLMGTSLLYLNPHLECQDKSLSDFQCRQQVCAKDKSEWKNYISTPLAQSLSTQYGPYQCDDENTLNLLRATLYAGVFCGYLIFLFFADNFGRRTSMILSWGVTVFGLFLLSVSWNMNIASFGLFLAGGGCQSSIRIGMAILSQVVDFDLRQKYSVALQSTFGISGILVGVMFYLIKQWRTIITLCCFLPSIIILFLFIFMLEETPKYLLKKGAAQTISALNRMSSINNSNIEIKYEDIVPFMQKKKDNEKLFTPLDLFIEPVLRNKTLCVSGIFFTLTYLYIGPIVIVDKLGYSPFRSQIIISSSQIIVYPLAFCLISLIPRRKAGYLACILSSIFTGILIFVEKPTVCDHCFEGNLQIVMIFCSRFCVSMYFTVFFVYIAEIFPLSTRALGFGIGSSAGAIASTSSQVIMPIFQQNNFNPMTLLTFFSLISLYFINRLPETLNVPLADEIHEQYQISQKMEQQSTQSYTTDVTKHHNPGQWSFASEIAQQASIISKTFKKNLEQIKKKISPSIIGFRPINPNQEI